MDPQARAILTQRQANLTALTKHPSWRELEAEVERKQVRLEKHILARTLGNTSEFSQREIDYLRGFVNGMKWLVAVPGSAESSLERFLQSQGVTLERE
jgi:hypothetical protein